MPLRVPWMQRDRWGRTGRQWASVADNKGQQGVSTLRECIGGSADCFVRYMYRCSRLVCRNMSSASSISNLLWLLSFGNLPARQRQHVAAMLQRVRSPTSHYDDRLSWCVHTTRRMQQATRRVRASFEVQRALESARDLLAQYLQPACARCSAQCGLVDTRSV